MIGKSEGKEFMGNENKDISETIGEKEIDHVNDNDLNNDLDKDVTLKRHAMNAIISNERKKGHAKGYQQALSEIQQSPSHHLSQEEIAKLVAQETQRALVEELNKHQKSLNDQAAVAEANNFNNKLGEASKKYGDEFVNNFNGDVYEAIKKNADHLVPHLNRLPNAEDVLFEISKYPEKLATLISYANAGMHNKLKSDLELLSKSYIDSDSRRNKGISLNRQPINEIQPSHTGVGKDLAKEMQDEIRKKYF